MRIQPRTWRTAYVREAPQFCATVIKSLPSANSFSTHSRTVASLLQKHCGWVEKSRKIKCARSPNCGRHGPWHSFVRWFIIYILLISIPQFMLLPFWQGSRVRLWETFAWCTEGRRRSSLHTGQRLVLKTSAEAGRESWCHVHLTGKEPEAQHGAVISRDLTTKWLTYQDLEKVTGRPRVWSSLYFTLTHREQLSRCLSTGKWWRKARNWAVCPASYPCVLRKAFVFSDPLSWRQYFQTHPRSSPQALRTIMYIIHVCVRVHMYTYTHMCMYCVIIYTHIEIVCAHNFICEHICMCL